MRSRAEASGWRGAALVACVYVYFLIFAQFGFITRLAELGLAGNALKLVMAAMAAGGILLSLAIPRIPVLPDPALRLRMGLLLSAVAALLTLAHLNLSAAIVVAFLIGAGLGMATVTLVTHLSTWSGKRHGILYVGIGTGTAYLICNVPAVFTAAPQVQAALAAALCAAACALPLGFSIGQKAMHSRRPSTLSFGIALVSFAALIWLDSAAFFIIQHTATLKAGTWLGTVHLWSNGALHFAAAIAAAVLLDRSRTFATLGLAFAALGFACVLLNNPALTLSASLFYPIGVSLYSVALVAWPSFLSPAETAAQRGRQAGWIYAIAGWIGSALGIGMGQNLGRVPITFVVIAGIAILAPACAILLKRRTRELAAIGVIAAVALPLYWALPPHIHAGALTPAQRGRQVYISEGCISCHSQYVRPNTPDVLMWGPVETLASIRAQKPPLIGNRRQGPDLAQVGLRRSPLWLKVHLVSPAEVSYRSPMPSFAFLFHDQRGDDLVAYLESLRGPGEEQQLSRQIEWQPPTNAWSSATAAEGEVLYQEHCATCHNAQGATRLHWINAWRKPPPALLELRAFTSSQPASRIAQIAKFGMPGTDMPGHEYLSDRQIAAVTIWLQGSRPDRDYLSKQ